MNIVTKLSNRIAKAKANRGQKGISLVLVLVLIILLGYIAYTYVRMAGDSGSADNQKVRLDSATLTSQAAQLRERVAVLASESEIAWTGVANKAGKLSLANATTDFTADPTVPNGPSGTDAAVISWNFGASAGSGYTPTAYAWTDATVNSKVCTALNVGLVGGTGTPVVAALDGLSSAPAQALAAGNSKAFTVSSALATALTTALAGQRVACVEAETGVYRVIARLN
jgi:Tfp pilus assembly protein PilX